MFCDVPLIVPRIQVRPVRWRHLPITLASRFSSRSSAPNALTTELQLTASASEPPSRVSQLLARLAAGATKPSDISTVCAMKTSEPAAMIRPIIGQCQPSRMVEPTSITKDGSSATSSVSLSRSSAHMPRVTLRTVEPAKLLACQSVEKRWTR